MGTLDHNLMPASNYGIECRMSKMQKITILVPEQELRLAVDATGKSISETVREGLRNIAHAEACKRILAARGKLKLDIDLKELREDRR